MRESFFLHTPDVSIDYKTEATRGEVNTNCHDLYEIIYVSDGSGKYTVEGKEYEIKPRTLLVIRPLEYYSLFYDGATPLERYSLRFAASALSADSLEMLSSVFDRSGGENYYFASALSPMMVSVLDRFEIAEQLSEPQKSAYVKALLSETIALLSALSEEKISHKEDELGAQVIRYINANINRNISLDKLAKRFFVSKYYLCRAFKRYNGTSVHSYVNQKRIMYAKQLIEGGETAYRAAYSVGFGDYSTFYRAYVRIVGKSPSEKGARNSV